MTRYIFLAVALAAVLAAGPVPAADPAEVATSWVRQLSRSGYDDINVSRTLLGRTRIVARQGSLEREIVLNPRTGEVLRDYFRRGGDGLQLPPEFGEGPSVEDLETENPLPDSGDDENDDDDDDDEDDGDGDDGDDETDD